MSDLGLAPPAAPPEDEPTSILDPIREEGVAGGLADIGGALLPGSRATGPTDRGGFGVGDLFRGFVEGVKSVPEYLPGVGDAIGIQQALTEHTDLFTKGVSFAGVLALPFAGVRGAQTARARMYGSRTPVARPEFPVTVGYTEPNIVSQLSNTPDIDTVLPSSRDFTRKSLLAGRHAQDPETGYRTLSAVVRGQDEPFDHLDQTAGYLQGFGQTLLDTVPDYRASIAEFGGDVDAAALGAAVQETSKWAYAADAGLIDGADDALVAWERVKSGVFDDLDGQTLAEAQTRFAQLTESFGHPELVLDDPRFTVSRIDLENGRVALATPSWDPIPLWQMDMAEANRRIGHMMALNPAQMLPHMTQNILDMWDGPVQQNWNRLQHAVPKLDVDEPWGSARDWYAIARDDTAALTEGQAFNQDELIGAASVLSAGELWETNIDKAFQALKHLRENPGVEPTRLRQFLADRGFHASLDDAERLIDMDQRGVAEFFARAPDEVEALKQPMFTKAINESELDDLIATGEAQYLLMSGKLDDATGGALFANARDKMPVVVDRHAFAIAMGFTIEPGSTSLTRSGNFDTIAQAYRIAASTIGEVDGRNLTPAELQAITWVMWREMKGVTQDFTPVAAPETWFTRRNMERPARPELANWFGLPPNWTGTGPAMVVSDRILKLLHEPPPMEMGVTGVARTSRFDGQPVDTLTGRWRSTAKKVAKRWRPSGDVKDFHGVELVAEEGAYRVEAPNDLGPDAMRTMYPSSAWGPKGPVWRPRQAAHVENVDDELQRIIADTVGPDGQPGATGGRKMIEGMHRNPAFEEGDHLVISIGDDTADIAHNQFVQLLKERGVKFNHTVEMPHEGPTLAWEHDGDLYWSAEELVEAGGDPATTPKVLDVEKRVSLVLDFSEPGELMKAYAAYREPWTGAQESAWQAAQGARGYWSSYGQAIGLGPPRMVREGLQADPVRGRAMAEAYEALPARDDSPEVIRSYEAMRTEVETQYRYMTEQLGVDVEMVNQNPYETPAEMVADVRDNNRLKVLATGVTEGDAGHPYFSNNENDMFRAVHDYFGHAAMGNTFSRHGEEAAWARHAQMFSDAARPAMTTETRGQNSFLNFSEASEARRAQGLEPEFGEQKLGLLPREYWNPPDDYFDGSAYIGKRIYPDQVIDLAIYSPQAPPGLTKVAEHHYTDPAGRRLVSMANEGDTAAPNVAPAWVEPEPDGLHSYFGRNESRRQATGGGSHAYEGIPAEGQADLFAAGGGMLTWDGAISVVGTESVAGFEDARHLLDVSVEGRRLPADQPVELFVPKRGTPVASFSGPAGGTPARTARLYRTGKNEYTVELPSPDGDRVQPDLHDDVRNLLARTGWNGRTRVVARGGWEPPAGGGTATPRAPRAPAQIPGQEGLNLA